MIVSRFSPHTSAKYQGRSIVSARTAQPVYKGFPTTPVPFHAKRCERNKDELDTVVAGAKKPNEVSRLPSALKLSSPAQPTVPASVPKSKCSRVRRSSGDRMIGPGAGRAANVAQHGGVTSCRPSLGVPCCHTLHLTSVQGGGFTR